MSIESNAILMGLIVFLLGLVIKKLGWAKDGVQSLWMTMAVALAVAVIDGVLTNTLAPFPGCQFVGGPIPAISCVFEYVAAVVKSAGIIWISGQGIYQLLRRDVAGVSILGPRI